MDGNEGRREVQSKRVLVVDGESNVALVLADNLKKLGFAAFIAYPFSIFPRHSTA